MRVMYFAFEGFDNPNGTNHLALKMIDYLLKEGLEIHLLSSHSRGIDPDIPPLLQGREGFTYDIVQRKVVNKRNFVQRYLEGIQYAFDCMKKWKAQRDRLDAIILQSTPTVFFSSVLLKLFCKKPVIFNSFDVFPNVAYDTGALTNTLVYKVLLFMQRQVYKNASKIIVISSDMKNTLMKQGVVESKIVEIKNWYDDETIHEVKAEENRFVEKYALPRDVFCVQYAGNFGYTFNYRYVLDVAEQLKEHAGIRFQMIGDGAFEKDFKGQAQERGLDNIDFYPWQPPSLLSDIYSCCDVSLIPLSNGVINNSFPSKGSLLMACGKVILCATEPESDYYRTINKEGVGICVSNQSPNEAAEAILALYRDKARVKEMGERARVYGVQYYSSSANLPKFKELLAEFDR